MTYIKNSYLTYAPKKVSKIIFPCFPAVAPAGAQEAFFSYHGGYSAAYEVSARIRMPKSRVKELSVNITANTLGTSSTVTLRKNAADTGLSGTIAAGATGMMTFVGDVPYEDGDILTVKMVIGGTAAQGITIRGGIVVAEVEEYYVWD